MNPMTDPKKTMATGQLGFPKVPLFAAIGVGLALVGQAILFERRMGDLASTAEASNVVLKGQNERLGKIETATMATTDAVNKLTLTVKEIDGQRAMQIGVLQSDLRHLHEAVQKLDARVMKLEGR